MNPTLDLLVNHRSIRKFTQDPVADKDIHKAIAAGQAASTSSAIQTYCAINITDPEKRKNLVELTGGQPYVAAAGAFLVICGDTRRQRLMCERAGQSYDARFEAMLLAVTDASLFAQNMAVAFESMGYGICFIGGLRLNLQKVDRLLDIPHGVYPLYGLCVGVPDQSPDPRPRLPVQSVLCENTYPTDTSVLNAIDAYDDAYRQYLRQRGAPDDKIKAAWSGVMVTKFSSPKREDVGPYYESKGAVLS
jgi:FMN reductase (NADPH)